MADSPHRRRHLNKAITLLTPRATVPADHLYQRHALLAGIWLTAAHIGRGELEQACGVGRTVLERLPHVNSPRCQARLRRVADQLRARKTNQHVREFSTELDRRLTLVG